MDSEKKTPLLRYCVLCEKAERDEKSGTVDITRIFEKTIIDVGIRGPGWPEKLPPVKYQCVLATSWTNGLGEFETSYQVISPSGGMYRSAGRRFRLKALDDVHNLFTTMDVSIEELGQYTIKVLLDGEVSAEFPWSIIMRPIPMPSLN